MQFSNTKWKELRSKRLHCIAEFVCCVVCLIYLLPHDRFTWSCSDMLRCIYHCMKRLVICTLFMGIHLKTDPLLVDRAHILSIDLLVFAVNSYKELFTMLYLILDDCFRLVLFHCWQRYVLFDQYWVCIWFDVGAGIVFVMFLLGCNDCLQLVSMLEMSGTWNQGSFLVICTAMDTAHDFGWCFVTHWYLVRFPTVM
jgi:hypothetical protein